MGDAGLTVKTMGSLAERGMQIASDQLINQENRKLQEKWNQRNEDFQREVNTQQQKNWQTQFDYQKQLNNTQMQREDNAIQRSVADHQAAGFNKLLAVGNQSPSGAMTTFGGTANQSASQGEAPQLTSTDLGNFISQIGGAMMEAKLNNAMISKTKAEADYTNQKTLTEVENTENMRIKNLSDEYKRTTDRYQRRLIMNQIRESESRIDTAYHNLGLSERRGIRTNDTLDSRALTVWALGNEFVSQYGDKALQEAKNWFGDGNNGYGNTPTPQKTKGQEKELAKFQNELWDYGDSFEDDTDLLDKLYKKFKNHKFVKDMNEKKAKAYLMNLYLNKVK